MTLAFIEGLKLFNTMFGAGADLVREDIRTEHTEYATERVQTGYRDIKI